MENDNTHLESKLFRIIVQASIIVSIISITGNLIIGFPLYINIKWIFTIILSIITIRFLKSGKLINSLRLIYFLSIMLVVFPCGWIDSGGINNNVTAYIYLGMICITFFFQKKLRNMLIILLIFTFISLLCLEYLYPQIMKTYDLKIQFLDKLIQIPLTLLGGYLLLKQFADAYMKEREILGKYSEELREANEKLEFMANRDSLTGAYNRRLFDSKFKKILIEKNFFDKDIYIVLFDIDNLKNINDTYGHSIGDEIICELAKTTEIIFPESSVVSRWGGDEYAIIFFGTIEELISCMDALYKKISDIKVIENKTITISSGITLISENDNMKEVFKRVDNALYESKHKGRNRYTVI